MRKLTVLGLGVALLAAAGAALAAPGTDAAKADGVSSEVVSLRRLTQDEYRNSIADIFGPGIEIRGMFEPTIRVGGLQAASTAVLSVTPAGFESYTKMADSIAVQVTGEKLRDRLPCTPARAKAADDKCAGKILAHYGLLLFRRPLTDAELKSRITLAHTLAARQKNFYAGMRYGLASLIQAPDFLFRKEVAVPDAGGKDYTLEPYSRATRLSYLLWNSTPDAELLSAAQTGALSTEAGLKKQAGRLMASPRLEAGMRAFFNDMLELDTFDTVSKDSLLYPKWGVAIANSAKEETLKTVLDLTLTRDGDVRDLMTTRDTYINRNLAAVYRVPFPFNGDWVRYEFDPKAGRSGIITQVSMLAMFSHPGRSSPTKRGVALTDILLCEPTPNPPNNVDFSIINDTGGPLKTVRQRLMAHATNPVCASCHNHSDPVGLTLEGFDTIGGFRTTENGEVIDLKTRIRDTTINGAEDLGRYLHDNPKFTACLARKMFAYARGENTMRVRPNMFQAAYARFVDSGFHLRALLTGLAEGPELYSAPPPKPASGGGGKVSMH
ncbi:MAG: DUF1592 domain-containing protein [Alphaproteobacteria bacterium]|nr:DUF1592 domain-containing protein [Alphaproteobacteria bacterium]